MARKKQGEGSAAQQGPAWPADKVERRSVASLVPYARNPRTHTPAQVDQIAASIREWGWTVPVLVDEEGGLITGHLLAPAPLVQLLPGTALAPPSVPFENMTRKSVFRSAVVLILLGLLMVLAALTNPVAISMAAATLLAGVVLIAIASFAGL